MLDWGFCQWRTKLGHHAKSILALPYGQVEISASCKYSVSAAREVILDAPLQKISECFGKDSSRTSDCTKENTSGSANRDDGNGNFSVLKLLQFSRLTIACTLNILSNQAQFRILKHAVNLFLSVIRVRNESRQAWKLREIEEEPSPTRFVSRTSPNLITNILIWNCRGAMKPTFRKTAMDLVEWHQLVNFVITENKIDGPRADEIIRRLHFDGAYSTEIIGFVGWVWLLWRLDFVSMDVLMATEQEIHAVVQVSSHAQP